ncbi:DapH/DapD/GlmU-related protein [Ferrovibrio sp.]|uniref:acyltransferase n=1 Tax=Ferrovibrio sp. TaxID=1917215 RepID=UPI00261781F3|nr:DapH/DapD/GlmU-related protein [Ferrovibrio sp.]
MNKQQNTAIHAADVEAEQALHEAGLAQASREAAGIILLGHLSAGHRQATIPKLKAGQAIACLGSSRLAPAEAVGFDRDVTGRGGRLVWLPASTASTGTRSLAAAIASGRLGRIRVIQIEWFRPASVIWEPLTDGLAALMALAGASPDEVTAQADAAQATVISAGLLFPDLQAQLLAGIGHPSERLAVIGEHGRVVWDGHCATLELHGAGPETLSLKQSGGPLATVHAVLDGHKGIGAELLRTVIALAASVATGRPASPTGEYWRTANVFVHASSVIDDGVSIGEGTKIWHFSHILPGVRIGRSVNIGQNVVIGPDVDVGDRCRIQNNVSLYKGVTLESGVFCGPSCVFTNVNNPRAEIERKSEYRPTLVRQGATIGANATIVCGHTLGRYCFIAAGAVITGDVPDFALMAGVPARRIGWVSHAGGRLGPDLICPIEGRQYRLTHDDRLEEVS